MNLLSKTAILAAQDLQTEDVEVPEWGGAVRVRVAAITKVGRRLHGLTQYIGHASLPTRTRGFPTRKRGW